MSSDADLADICAETYVPPTTVQIGSDLAANVIDQGERVVVAFRGTINIEGWIRDFDALPKSHPLLGYCHSGFLSGACALVQTLTIPKDKTVVLTGHSLGGALAVLVGALRIAVGERVDTLVTFGAPRAGFRAMRALWLAHEVRQYRRGNDPVTDVPLDIPIMPYTHLANALISIGKPDPDRAWNCHSIRGYAADLR